MEILNIIPSYIHANAGLAKRVICTIGFILLSLSLSSCYTDFVPEIDAKPVLCINSLITAGEPIKVEVSRTWVYTDQEGEKDHSVKDAVVTVYANNRQVGEDYIPLVGDEIRIHAFSPTYGEAEATVTIPVAPVVEDVDFTPIYRQGWLQDYEDGSKTVTLAFDVSLRFSISDSADRYDYYHYDLECYPEWTDYFPEESEAESLFSGSIDEDSNSEIPFFCNISEGSLKYNAEPIFGEHISEYDAVMGGDSEGFSFFTDRQFSGASYRMNLQYRNAHAIVHCREDNYKEVCDGGFIVCMSSVSESYYNWSNYCWQYYSGALTDMSDLGLSDPVIGYSNVSTGGGVVAARSMTKITLPLNSFLQERVKKAFEK